MTNLWHLQKFPNSTKKFRATELSTGKSVTFGAQGYSDYTKHKDEKRMKRYLNRHKKRENWTKSGKYTAGFWSRWLLWGKPSLAAAKAQITKKFGIKFTNKKPQTGKGRKIPKSYLPKSLTKGDRKKQLKSILEKKDRPKVKSFKSKRSSWTKKFENKYNTKITNKKFIDKNILKKEGQEKIIKKGMAAYYTSGSRPNQTPFSWGYARLASVIMNGKARKVDKKIWDKYKQKGGRRCTCWKGYKRVKGTKPCAPGSCVKK